MFYYVIHAGLQILDGLLTIAGITKFGGTHVEGNPLLRELMETVGTTNAVILAKMFAILVIITICQKEQSKLLFKAALLPINLLYTISAIFWLYALYII